MKGMKQQPYLYYYLNTVVFTVLTSFQAYAQETAEKLAKKLSNPVSSTTRVFINPSFSRITKLGKQTVSLTVGPCIPLEVLRSLNPISVTGCSPVFFQKNLKRGFYF